MRCLLLILLLSCFAASAFAQTPTNPHNPEDGCGLPPQGVIVASVTYTLNRDCMQTGVLEIKTSQTPSIRLEINGGGHTITNTSYLASNKATYLYNFLVVDDNGDRTLQNVDNGRSPNVEVIIKNVTFDGENVKFQRPWRTQSPPSFEARSAIGAGILVDGDLTMENVTFTRGNGIWVRAKGTASLTNVLFEDSLSYNFGFGATVRGVLHVAKSASVTLNKAVFRNIDYSVVVIEKGGRLGATGCLSFTRVWSHKVHHSGKSRNFGAWSDGSSGACPSGTVGNGGAAVVAYTLPELPCRLPASGDIEGTQVYTLTQDCVCMGELIISAGARVTINGNGLTIRGCETGSPRFRIADAQLTINNASIYGVRIYNYGGRLSLNNSMVASATKPLMNYGWAFVRDSVFQENRATRRGAGKAYYGHAYYGMGRVLFQDNVFRSNSPADDEVEAYTEGIGSAIYLCGDNIIEGLTEDESAARELALFIAENGGSVSFSCLQDDTPSPPPPPPVGCAPAYEGAPPEQKHLGAIGVMLYVEKCPPTIEIWEILPNSQGVFALKVSQDFIETMNEGDIICSANERAAVRIGLTEPVRQIMAYSKTYVPPSQRGGRDILVSLGPNYENKVHHLVIDHALDGTVMGAVDTRPAGPPCLGARVSTQTTVSAKPAAPPPAPPPQPTPIPIAAPVSPQPAQADGSIVHVVQPGDTIWAMGVAYNVHPYRIIALNDLENPTTLVVKPIFPGQELLIRPAP